MKNVDYMSLLKSFETLSLYQQIEQVADTCEASGFTVTERYGRNGLVNFYYTRGDVDTVYVVIYKGSANQVYYTLLDKDVFHSVIETHPKRVINFTQRHDNSYKIVFAENYTNYSLHRCVLECTGKDIDHISRNVAINTREMLRVCNSSENMRNTKFYSQINRGTHQFSVPDKFENTNTRMSLVNQGFIFAGGRLISPSYHSDEQMFSMLNQFEAKLFNGFNYNPLVDFSCTWYAYAVHKLFGVLNLIEAMEYNRDFFLRNDEAVAEYYQLAS